MKELKQRMYHLVLYSLSPIQKGIQSYHAGIRYASKFGISREYTRWAVNDETVIILDGGSSNDETYGERIFGGLQQAINDLETNGINHAEFREVDFNNTLTAIAFLVDERVWDLEKYPDPPTFEKPFVKIKSNDEYLKHELEKLYGHDVGFLRPFLRKFPLAR
jgi:hypothetical protein